MEEPGYRVYVIELDDSLRKGTDKPAVYVGYSVKSPERFAQHLRGERASRRIRRRPADPKPNGWNGTWPTGSVAAGSPSTAVTDVS